jgi:hypothetical protein
MHKVVRFLGVPHGGYWPIGACREESVRFFVCDPLMTCRQAGPHFYLLQPFVMGRNRPKAVRERSNNHWVAMLDVLPDPGSNIVKGGV